MKTYFLIIYFAAGGGISLEQPSFSACVDQAQKVIDNQHQRAFCVEGVPGNLLPDSPIRHSRR